MRWKLLKTLQVEPKDETDFPVRALTRFDVYTFILCSLGLCCEVSISLLPCGQLLMSSCLFEKLSLSVFRLTVLPHTCSSLICRFSHDLLFPPSLSLFSPTLPVSDRPTDSFHCLLSLQVYPRRSVPAVDRLCVGVPAAEVSCAAAQSHKLPPGLAQMTALLMPFTTHTDETASLLRLWQNNWTWAG